MLKIEIEGCLEWATKDLVLNSKWEAFYTKQYLIIRKTIRETCLISQKKNYAWNLPNVWDYIPKYFQLLSWKHLPDSLQWKDIKLKETLEDALSSFYHNVFSDLAKYFHWNDASGWTKRFRRIIIRGGFHKVI